MSTFRAEAKHDISTKLMSQFSGAKTDPYTNHVASIMCKDLKPGPQGQRRVNSALSNLPVFFTPDEKLTFGWGFEHIIRNNEVHQGGYEHFTIMVAMAESFHSSWAAEICHEMAKSKAGPKDSLPHLSQWLTILRACNGALASSEFGVTVEDYIRLDPYNLRIGLAEGTHLPLSAKEIVLALHALAEVVSGRTKELVLTGSAVLGWYGAAAEVLYDLHVAVFSSKGETLKDTKSGEPPQLKLIFREKTGIEVLSNSSNSSNSSDPKPQGLMHSMANLGIASQQYALSVHSTPFGGRVDWNSLLPRVFGASFGRLDREESRTFSGMVGAAARLFEGLAHRELADEELISEQNKSNPSSYGAGLVQTLTNWLPELRRFQGRMERALKLDYKSAAAAYRENLTKLREICHCGICYSKPGDENSGEGPDHGYCLVTLVESVMALGLALSRVTVAAQIFPTRAGMQGLYRSQVDKRLQARGKRWQDHFSTVYGDEFNAKDSRHLQVCVALFSGSLPVQDLPDNLVAIAHEGMVAYILRLEKSTPGKADKAMIRVSSGVINVREKTFRRACLGPVPDTSVDDLWEAVDVEHLDVP